MISGGFLEPDNSGDVVFTRSTPNIVGNSWQVTAKNNATALIGAAHSISAYAVCAAIT
jgi:hypothetical protein